MQILGLPAHILFVHAAVVLSPLAVILSIVFAMHRRSRYLTRWPQLAFAVGSTAAVWAARLTGEDLQHSRQIPESLIREHADRGETLSLIMIVFAVLAVAAAYLLGGESGLVSGRGARDEAVVWVDAVVRYGLVLAAVATLVWVALTGDAGARAVWG